MYRFDPTVSGNTNTNSFIELNITDSKVERSGSQIFLGRYQSIPYHYRFPSMAYSGDNQVIVTLTHPNEMNDGQVYLLVDGVATRLFATLNDITAIYLKDNTVYAADYDTHSVWLKNLATQETEKLSSDSYQRALHSFKESADKAWINFLVLAFLIMAGGILTLIISLKKSKPANT